MKKLVTFRLDAEVLAKAKRLAERDNRTLTNLIETILKRALDGKAYSHVRVQAPGDEA